MLKRICSSSHYKLERDFLAGGANQYVLEELFAGKGTPSTSGHGMLRGEVNRCHAVAVLSTT
jgi:hypothetical protein